MAKDKKEVKEVKGAAEVAPVGKYIFVRDYDLFVSINPNLKKSFKKDDVLTDKAIIERLKVLQPPVIKPAG